MIKIQVWFTRSLVGTVSMYVYRGETIKKQTAENKHSINHNNGITVHVHEHGHYIHQGCGFQAVPLEEEGTGGIQDSVSN